MSIAIPSQSREPGPYHRIVSVASKPRTWPIVFLLVMLPLFFSVGRYIPMLKWTLEIGILLSFGAAAFSNAGGRKAPSNPFNIYILMTALGLPLLGAASAYIVFGQPILYGLAAQRGCFLAFFSYAIGNLIGNNKVTLGELKIALIILAWINLFICTPVLVLLDPNNYSDVGALVSDGGGVFNEFHLPMTFIIYGAMYYATMWFLSDRAKYGLLALPFILYIVAGNNGRVLNITLVMSLIAISWIGSPHKRVKNISAAIALAIVVVVAVAVVNPEKIEFMVAKYHDAFAAVSGAYDVADISANARILQTEIAWPYIYSSPVIGTGAISNEWNGGYEHMFGYFHPADLGLIGVVFIYGIVGLLFFAFQYLVLAKISAVVMRETNKTPYNDLLLSIYATLLFMMISSVVTGSFILVPEQSLFFFSVLIAHINRYRMRSAS